MKRNVFAACLLIAAVSVLSAESASEYFTRGVDAQEREDWYTATQNFIEATDANPAYGDAWFRLAQCTYQLGQYDLVLEYLDKAEQFRKGSAEIKNLRGMTFIALGRAEEARTLFRAVLKAEPNDVESRFGLAELDLADGKMSSAESWYRQALSRQNTNRKALLSLALISAGLGKQDEARGYMEQALRYYSGEPEVHYLASCLSSISGNLAEAERQARAAVEINGNYDKAYAQLSSVLYAEEKYTEAADICDFRIGRDRSLDDAWFLKGMTQYRRGDAAGAVTSWTTGLSINPDDEVMRAALEIAVNDSVPIEDSRRNVWASYHLKNAREFARRYDSSGESYEYQRALKVDPLSTTARTAYASMLKMNGFPELYVEQLRFMKALEDGDSSATPADATKAAAKKSAASVTRDDTIEGYDSLLENSLAKKWNVQPFYIDKIRWKIGIYYIKSTMQFVHVDVNEIAAEMAADLFSGAAVTSVQVQTTPVTGYGDAFRRARSDGMDYFAIVSVDEGVRDVTLSSTLYSGRTGTKTAELSFYGSGNNRFANVLRRFRDSVLTRLAVRGKILDRDGTIVLIDLGKADLLEKDAKLDVVRRGGIMTADTGPGIVYQKSDVVGTVTVTRADEEISECTLEKSGFYDKVNTGDEVVLLSLPVHQKAAAAGAAEVVGTGPQANAGGVAVSKKKEPLITSEDLKMKRTPAYIDLIRGVY